MSNEVTSSVLDLHDSEIARIGDVVEAVNGQQGNMVNLEDFRRQIIERFEKVGFKVEVKCWSTDQDGLWAFDIDIVERLEGRFDPDQQVYEVTHDELGLGEGGVIKTTAAERASLLQGHSHGPGGHKH